MTNVVFPTTISAVSMRNRDFSSGLFSCEMVSGWEILRECEFPEAWGNAACPRGVGTGPPRSVSSPEKGPANLKLLWSTRKCEDFCKPYFKAQEHSAKRRPCEPPGHDRVPGKEYPEDVYTHRKVSQHPNPLPGLLPWTWTSRLFKST